jgi:superfamily II DNA helicase RecQ
MLESLLDMPPRDPAEILRTVFGHKSFRGQQEDVVRHVTDGGDAVVLFPTGAGKSMCYQIPAICRAGRRHCHLAAHCADARPGRGAEAGRVSPPRRSIPR